MHESEIFEDNPDISPAVMAEILCPEDHDCKIRVSVYYSSNLTGNKDVVLAGTVFGLRELLRSYKMFSSVMNSDYCVGAKTRRFSHRQLFTPWSHRCGVPTVAR